MDRRRVASKIYRFVFCAMLFFVAAAASFHGFYDKWHFHEPGVVYGAGRPGEPRLGLDDILDGTADRPFVYRQFLPTLANWIDRGVPDGVRNRLYLRVRGDDRTIDIMHGSPMARNPRYFFRYLIIYLATFLFSWLAVFAMYLVCKAIGLSEAACIFAPVTMILLFPYFLSIGGYFYDYGELAFFALAVWMALKFDWWWMLPLVALATWNKESFLFIVVTLYPLLRARASRHRAITGTAVLAVTSAAVYSRVHVQFSQNGGGTVTNQWRNQLQYLLHGKHFFDWEKTYGIPGVTAFTIVPLAIIAWIVWRAWPRLPKEIRRHSQIAAAINFPLFAFFCAPQEIRNLSMMFMLFFLSLAVNIASFTQDPDLVHERDMIENAA
jgi:hypothetical protein